MPEAARRHTSASRTRTHGEAPPSARSTTWRALAPPSRRPSTPRRAMPGPPRRARRRFGRPHAGRAGPSGGVVLRALAGFARSTPASPGRQELPGDRCAHGDGHQPRAPRRPPPPLPVPHPLRPVGHRRRPGVVLDYDDRGQPRLHPRRSTTRCARSRPACRAGVLKGRGRHTPVVLWFGLDTRGDRACRRPS